MSPPTLAEVRFFLCALSPIHMHTHSHTFTHSRTHTDSHTPSCDRCAGQRGGAGVSSPLLGFPSAPGELPLASYSWRPSLTHSLTHAELIVIHIKGMEKGNLGLVIPLPPPLPLCLLFPFPLPLLLLLLPLERMFLAENTSGCRLSSCKWELAWPRLPETWWTSWTNAETQCRAVPTPEGMSYVPQ